MTKAQVEKALDAIYGGEPSEFIKGRDALAKKLREDGDEAADDVKRLRKPSKAAAVVNALALERPKPLKIYLGLADKLRKATSGKVDAAKMRSLAREDGELLEELVAEAGKLADGASASTLDRVRETLQAAQVDSELGERLLSGRIEREERAASVGLDNLAAPPKAARKWAGKVAKAAEDEAPKKRKAHEAELKRKALAEAKATLADAKAEAREAGREVARAESALTKAERARDAAEGRAERAESKLEKLR